MFCTAVLTHRYNLFYYRSCSTAWTSLIKFSIKKIRRSSIPIHLFPHPRSISLYTHKYVNKSIIYPSYFFNLEFSLYHNQYVWSFEKHLWDNIKKKFIFRNKSYKCEIHFHSLFFDKCLIDKSTSTSNIPRQAKVSNNFITYLDSIHYCLCHSINSAQ